MLAVFALGAMGVLGTAVFFIQAAPASTNSLVQRWTFFIFLSKLHLSDCSLGSKLITEDRRLCRIEFQRDVHSYNVGLLLRVKVFTGKKFASAF